MCTGLRIDSGRRGSFFDFPPCLRAVPAFVLKAIGGIKAGAMDSNSICNGAGVEYATRIAYFRWGGGAHLGKTHVFGVGVGVIFSQQCVTDDFGNLVPVVAK